MNKTIISLIALAAIVSCDKEPSTTTSGSEVVPQFSTESCVTRVATSTDTTTDSTWEVGDQIGISSTNSETNVPYSVSTIASGKATFAPVGEQILLPRNQEVSYTAYYPYQTTVAGSYISDVSDQSDLGAIDFLVSDTKSCKEDGTTAAEFAFTHALAMVKFSFSLGDDLEDVYTNFTSYQPSLVIMGAYTTYGYSYAGVANGSYTGNATGNISVPVSGSSATAIINPTGASQSITLLCTFDTHVYEYTLSGFNPAANTITTYSVTIGFDEISIKEEPVIKDWTTTNGGDGELDGLVEVVTTP